MPDTRPAREDKYQTSHYAMGTMFSITMYGTSRIHMEEAASQALEEIDRLEAMMSHYRPNSELSIINRKASDGEVKVSTELFQVLAQSLELSRKTGGAFDITVGPLMKLWGFFQRDERFPAPHERLDLRRRTGFRHVHLDPLHQSVRFDEPGVELDLGAIGKGYAVDRAIAILRRQGTDCALISAGRSSIYALGAPPGATGWNVSIRHPLDRTKEPVELRLRDRSVSISGTRERSFLHNAKLYGDMFDLERSSPANKTLLSIVIGHSSTETDALSTAFFVQGVDLAESYLKQNPSLDAILFPQIAG